MKELQLVGYTADLHHLVFTDAAGDGGRFKAPIDEEFVSTLGEVLELVDPDAAPLAGLDAAAALATAASTAGAGEEAAAPERTGRPTAHRGHGALAAMALVGHQGGAPANGAAPAERPRESRLAPREIQALLRAGMGPRTVAKQADTDEQWVRRWLPPIEAERDQILQGVWSSFVAKSRLGVSEHPVGEAIDRNLAAKGVQPDDPSIQWTASRREGDAHWQVTLRYRSRGRAQRASWRFQPETGALEPRNSLAVDIAWTRPGDTRPSPARAGWRGGRAQRPAERHTSSKTAPVGGADPTEPAGGSAPSTTGGSMAAAKKGAARKAAAKKGAAKKGAKRSAAKKAAAKKAAAKKGATRKAAAKKAAAKKGATRKAAAKKGAAKKSSAKKSSAKKGAARKGAAKKAAKKGAAKKGAAKKSSAKKGAPKRSSAKKGAAKKSSARKSARKGTSRR